MVVPLWSADFLQEVVRDGLGQGVGDHRDVTVQWNVFIFSLSHRK